LQCILAASNYLLHFFENFYKIAYLFLVGAMVVLFI
jgi:hypothetical protein